MVLKLTIELRELFGRAENVIILGRQGGLEGICRTSNLKRLDLADDGAIALNPLEAARFYVPLKLKTSLFLCLCSDYFPDR